MVILTEDSFLCLKTLIDIESPQASSSATTTFALSTFVDLLKKEIIWDRWI